MYQSLRIVWVIAILINLAAVIWFILGATANFQRGLDLVSSVVLLYAAIPSLILIVVSLTLLFKAWPPATTGAVIVNIIIICSMLIFSPVLFTNVYTSGWLKENVRTEPIQKTKDGHYEYQLELVNLFQRNSSARLYLKNISTGEEFRIPLDLDLSEITFLNRGEDVFWSVLESLEPNKYVLRSTERFPIKDLKYEVDIEKQKAVLLE